MLNRLYLVYMESYGTQNHIPCAIFVDWSEAWAYINKSEEALKLCVWGVCLDPDPPLDGTPQSAYDYACGVYE